MVTQREPLPPCCHALGPGCKWSSKPNFTTELTKSGVSTKGDGVQRLANDLSEARAALHLGSASVHSIFQSADDVPSYTQKLARYLALVKGFTEATTKPQNADPKALQLSAPVTDATANDNLRQPLVEGNKGVDGTVANDCSGCLNFCRWQDALTGQVAYAQSARQEYAHVLLAGGILMMTDARDKVDTILSERLTELNETQLKLAYQLLLHASGVLEACLESIDVTPRSVGAEFADLGANTEVKIETQRSKPAVPDGETMAKWREEQQAIPSTNKTESSHSARLTTEDLAMLKRVPDLAEGHFSQLLAWISLAEAEELAILRAVTREVVDFSLMAKLSMDVSTRYTECQALASRLMTSTTAERIHLYCGYKSPYYHALSIYFQGAACMLVKDARHCAQAVANLKKAAMLFEGVVPLEKNYEAKMAVDKAEKERVTLLAAIFLRSQQVINRDLDIVTRRNDTVYYEPVPAPESKSNALSLVKPAAFPSVSTSDLWCDDKVANCLKPTAVAVPVADADDQQQSRVCNGCCSSCIIS